MKLQPANEKSVKSKGITNSVKFGVKASGLHHILGILRNQLYSDKALAVIREYSCNAVDAHTQAGCSERPIEVSIPNRLNPNFKVRDFGPALNDTEIQDVYAFYGESTKRNTNDQIGMLGIGSKSAFAYGDNFVIHSFIDGEKHIYNAFIDPSKIGQISKIGQEETDEENGIEIVVPVQSEDCQEFEEKAKDLFKWFKVRPIIKGAKQFDYEKDKTIIEGDGWRWVHVGNSHSYSSRNGEATIVMGCIGYPVNWYSLNCEDGKLKDLLQSNLVLDVPIGDVEISADREKLQYTDYTRKSIIKKLEKVRDEIADKISEKFNSCKTLFAAKCLHGEVFDYGNNLYALRNIVDGKLIWNGKVVKDSTFEVPSYYNHQDNDGKMLVHHYKKSHRSTKFRGETAHNISCSGNTIVVENDMGHRRGIMGRLLPFILEQEKDVYLTQFDNDKVRKDWIKKTGFDFDMPKMSELDCRKLSDFSGYAPTPSGGSAYDKNPLHTSKEFIFDWDKAESGNSWDRAKSQYFKKESVDLDAGGIYIIVDKFEIECNKGAGWNAPHPTSFAKFRKKLEKCGIHAPKKLYAFKIGVRNKVEGKDKWVCYWSWVKAELLKQIKAKSIAQKFVDRNAAADHQETWIPSASSDEYKYIKDHVTMKNTDILDASDKFSFMFHKDDAKAIDSLNELSKEVGLSEELKKSVANIKPTYNLKKIVASVGEKYGMLKHLGYNYRYGRGRDGSEKELRKDIVNYINVVDISSSNPKRVG
jgi:hypothetical protein